MPLAWLSPRSQSLPLLPTSGLCPFRCWFLGGWTCVCSSILWASPMDSPVRLGISPAAATPTDFYSQWFWGFSFPCWNPGLHGLSHSPVIPLSLSACECGMSQSASHRLIIHPLYPSFLSLPLPPVWMNVSLTPWLSDFHTVWVSDSSGCFFLFVNWLLSFFWLCKEAKHIYLCLHLGQKSLNINYFNYWSHLKIGTVFSSHLIRRVTLA